MLLLSKDRRPCCKTGEEWEDLQSLLLTKDRRPLCKTGEGWEDLHLLLLSKGSLQISLDGNIPSRARTPPPPLDGN